MIQYFRPSFWQNAIRDEFTWLALAVDFVPVFMVLFFGWRAEALVLLYWAENVVIGLATLVRIIWSGFASAGVLGGAGCLFLAAFFTVHYGMFCFGHGVFIIEFAPSIELDNAFSMGFPSPASLFQMVDLIRVSFVGMTLALGLIALYQFTAAIRDYWPTPGKTYPNPTEEMFSPYGRIVVLHIGIFAGAFALMALGDPMIGVLFLIVLRMGFSVLGRAWRDRRREKSNTVIE